MAWTLTIFYTPHAPTTYWVAISAMLICGALAFLLLLLLSRVAIRLVTRVDYHWISVVTLVILLGIVVLLTGWQGMLIAVVSTGIGLLPVMWGARRMNCLGVLLLPLTLSLAGLGTTVAGWMGLI
jgi:putative membrane protein